VKIVLTGGIFGDPMGQFATSPLEAVLRRFLTEAGHEVVPVSTHSPVPLAAPADVYHAHHFGTAPYHLALNRVGPLVFTSQNPFLISDFDESESRADRTLQGLVLRRADAVVLNSQREARLLGERFGLEASHVHVIPSGLDLDLYGPANGRPSNTVLLDGVELLAVGQLVEYKGHGYLLDAVAQLAPRYPGLRLAFVTHQPALREQYERRSRELGIADRITYEGPLETSRLAERIRETDVVVQPSLAECFPVTVLEAMASAKPVVVTDVGGMPEQVGDTGVVVPPRDSEALAAALEPLVASEDERRRLGEAALERARSLFDGREIVRRHVELYTDLLDRRRQPGLARQAATRAALAAYERKRFAARLVPASVRRRQLLCR
jgi:glycosyltransferase involved in cell wall biosynthesis